MSDKPAAVSGTASLHTRIRTDEVVDAFLSAFAERPDAKRRPAELLDSYRTLARAVIRHGLEPAGKGDAETDLLAAVDRELGRVAAASRRAGLSIATTLEDLGTLAPATVAFLQERARLSQDESAVLRTMGRVVLAIQSVAVRLVRLLEESTLRARRERDQALAAVSDLMSHELGNRLGAAQTASRMLTDPSISLDEEGRSRATELVQTSVDAALQTLGDVRSLILSGADVEKPPTRSMPLPSLVRGVLEEVRARADAAGVTVRVEGDIVDRLVDASRCRLILFNLVWNGIKYHDPNEASPFVSVRSRERPDGEVEITVTDNGLGIPEEDIEDIFEYRVRGGGASDVPGSGLGLAIVTEAVAQMGGEISVQGEEGAGASFTLAFPPAEAQGERDDT